MKRFNFFKGKIVPSISVKENSSISSQQVKKYPRITKILLSQVHVEKCSCLENLGPFFDNTKLIVAGLIFIPLKYLGFV